MESPVRYVPASKRSHDLVWDRVSGDTLTLEDFLEGRDYGEVVRDGRLAAELELLDGTPRYVCPHCKDAMGVGLSRREIHFHIGIIPCCDCYSLVRCDNCSMSASRFFGGNSESFSKTSANRTCWASLCSPSANMALAMAGVVASR